VFSDLESGLLGRADAPVHISPQEVINDFKIFDSNTNGEISAAEFIHALRNDGQLASKFGLSDDVLHENGSSKKYKQIFKAIDYDRKHALNVCKMLRYFGHGDLPTSQLAGLLSDCGYIGDRLRATLDKAEKASPKPPIDPPSTQVQATGGITKKQQKHKRQKRVPEPRIKFNCTAFCLICAFVGSFFSSMGE
jgi:hypothetical protein